MLLLVLHSSKDYLEELLSQIQKQPGVEATMHSARGLGEEITGSRMDIFSGVIWASVTTSFDHALIVALNNPEDIVQIKRLILQNMDLCHSSGKCLVINLPYNQAKTLEEKLAGALVKQG